MNENGFRVHSERPGASFVVLMVIVILAIALITVKSWAPVIYRLVTRA